MMKPGSRDIISGGILLILSIVLYLVIPGQVETLESDTLSPAFLPLLMTGIIGLLSTVLLYQGLLRKTKGNQPLLSTTEESAVAGKPSGIGGLIYAGAAMGVMIVYVMLIPWAGYILSTAAVLIVLAILFGNRNRKQILIMVVIAPPAILLFFRYTLLVLLPQGKLFG